MAVKNWLIRTTQNQILGPVSKEKIIELIRTGKLEEDDEVSSGNGYWFYIREDDLVEKYLIGDIPQSFNPVYEIEPILTRQVKKDKTSTLGGAQQAGPDMGPIEIDESAVLPGNEDLEYPDIEINLDDIEDEDGDITVVGQIPIPSADELGPPSSLPDTPPEAASKNEANLMSRASDPLDEERARPGKLPDADDLEYPDLGMGQELIDEKFEVPGDDAEEEEEEYTMVGAAPIVQSASLDEFEEKEVVEPSIPEPVEIFEEVDPDEDDLPVQEVKVEAPVEMPKPPKAVAEDPESTPKKKQPSAKKQVKKNSKKRSKEFAESHEVTGDAVIDDALRQSSRKRSQRGRRRGIDTYLILFFGSIIIIAFAVIFYYKVVLKKKLPFISSLNPISSAHAQTLVSVKKKR
jgi:hypothetical protein